MKYRVSYLRPVDSGTPPIVDYVTVKSDDPPGAVQSCFIRDGIWNKDHLIAPGAILEIRPER